MTPRLQAELARNHGLITRQRSLELGLTDREVKALLRTGEWVRIRRGVYCRREVFEAAPTRADKQLLVDRAACLKVAPPFVRSHTSAALELGIPVLLPDAPLTHVTRDCLGTHKEHGVQHHLAPYRPDQVMLANGFSVLDPVRTAVDIARRYGHPYGVVAIDRVRWLGHPVSSFTAVLDSQMTYWPDRSKAVRELELSAPGAESVAETLARTLLEELGLGGIETQFGLTDGRVTHYADLRIGRHLIEVDGRTKYLKQDAGGVAVRDVTDVVLDEKAREDWFRAFHLGVSRLTWSDVWGPGREAAKARLLREIGRTERLWGMSIDDLERFRARPRRRAA